MENWMDDTAFYERFDQEIYKFVEEVEKQLNSVATEREILSKYYCYCILTPVSS